MDIQNTKGFSIMLCFGGLAKKKFSFKLSKKGIDIIMLYMQITVIPCDLTRAITNISKAIDELKKKG